MDTVLIDAEARGRFKKSFTEITVSNNVDVAIVTQVWPVYITVLRGLKNSLPSRRHIHISSTIIFNFVLTTR